MSRFCPNCGRELPANIKFCPGCGKPVQEEKKAGPPKALIPALVCAAAVAAVAVIGFNVFNFVLGRGYREPLKNLEKGLNTQDMRLIGKAYSDGVDLSYTDDLLLGIDQMSGTYKVTFKVEDADKIDRNEIVGDLTQDYWVPGDLAQKASAAYVLDVEINSYVDRTRISSNEMEIPVVKIDGHWGIPVEISNSYVLGIY